MDNPTLGHEGHTWEQVGLCVYCVDCEVRLYQGTVPADRRPSCDEHRWDDESGQGYYSVCERCGAVEWLV